MKLPYLAYESWKDTKMTLHLIMQIIGKIRLHAAPRKNHWWYITEYVTSNGFSTAPIPMADGLNTFEITLNVHRKTVHFENSKGERHEISLVDGYTVSSFYKDSLAILSSWGEEPKFVNKPLDLGIDKPFKEITEYHHYDWTAIHTFWQMMLWNDRILKEFSGRFYGKTCPVHIYWHHLDLTVTRFSGRKAPAANPKASALEKDAYSHEVISFGFWAGDDNLPEPAYYSYTFPSPKGLEEEPLLPDTALWTDANGSPMAILKYQDVVSSSDPAKTVLDFLESAYQAGAKRANWDVEGLKVLALDQL
ncbi:hypothetical protein CLV98_11325 [Dyadobacter jejuensis]|uniref:Ava_C0101 and related proteins n=1 Tax=Dyadobacter jejuensis TaxID=1082580 RepID=A0A316ADW8_9BACT|nr:DUF5996 family protein [Dyadobacter jejuensis]PWJ55549.1 hypothetical protein CLV98_11325 [Dyadobacter jejuensis]